MTHYGVWVVERRSPGRADGKEWHPVAAGFYLPDVKTKLKWHYWQGRARANKSDFRIREYLEGGILSFALKSDADVPPHIRLHAERHNRRWFGPKPPKRCCHSHGESKAHRGRT